MGDAVVDGRIARGNRTREAVIDALFELYAEGNLTPTIEEIATRIGKTTRSIYHHYNDREALVAAMAQRQVERHGALLVCGPIIGTRSERVDGIVQHRSQLFEAVAPTRRAALAVMHTSPELRRQHTNLAVNLRKQLTGTFRPELSGLERSARADMIELLDLHTSWETWDRLRSSQGLSAARTRRLMTDLVNAVLDR